MLERSRLRAKGCSTMVTRLLPLPFRQRTLQAGLLAGTLILTAGCKQLSSANKNEAPQTAPPSAAATAPAPAPPSDQEIANDIQSRINAESALNGQNIKVTV